MSALRCGTAVPAGLLPGRPSPGGGEGRDHGAGRPLPLPRRPTERGTRHLHELIRAVEEGYQATAFFVIQMENALDFAPNDDTDPAFGQALRQAAGRGWRSPPIPAA